MQRRTGSLRIWGGALSLSRERAPRSSRAGRDEGAGLRYRPQLDGLRFCAIAAVVVEHNWDPPAAPWIFGRLDYAEFGVRLFFVLSGFLITGILIRGREMADASGGDRRGVLRHFYARRFLRIFPI